MFLDEPSAVTLALEAMRTGPFLLEMPTVFGLFAPPTRSGVRWLNTAKARLPNKTYGTVLGRLRSFHALAMPGSLPSCFDDVEQLRALEGAFLRMRVADETVNTPVLRGGTHQSLLIREGPHRQFFREMEKALAGEAEPELFGGWRCSALLCTSANVSGHSEGSITDLSRARAFAREHGIELLIRSSERALALGSYPILAFHPEHVSVARVGPGLEDIARLLPEGLLER
jgi:tRNA A37 threonylcarbamoyladenosine synthetase subunit TsaC/SUA5/YrdC